MDLGFSGRPFGAVGRLVLAGCWLATGASLVVYVLAGLASLAFVLAVILPVAVLLATVVVLRLPNQARAAVAARALAGALAGVAATAAYDASRWVTATTVAANIDPFAAWPVFGRALAGVETPTGTAVALGLAYHLTNGLSFAVGYAILMPRGGVWGGIAWGLALEAAMLSLYPGWLDIRALREFTAVSMLGHVFYGATLGLLVPVLLDRSAVRTQMRVESGKP